MKAMVRARWPACSAWWAMVSVTPEVSSSAVLMVGSQNGPTVWKGSTLLAGEAVAPAAMLGQTALKSGHSKLIAPPPESAWVARVVDRVHGNVDHQDQVITDFVLVLPFPPPLEK